MAPRRGPRDDEIERAIASYEAALEVAKADQFPDLLATLKSNQADARLERLQGLAGRQHRCRYPGLPRSADSAYAGQVSRGLGESRSEPGGTLRMRVWGNLEENLELSIEA
jgi:hypothetical protein